MMEGTRSYLLSVAAAALIFSLLSVLMGEKNGTSKIIKLISGVFLAAVVMKPCIQLKLKDWKTYEEFITEMSIEPVIAGERMAEEAVLQSLSEKTELRIRQEAEKLGCQLDVDVSWEGFRPIEITLQGPISPYGKTTMIRWIAENVGISEASQIWIG